MRAIFLATSVALAFVAPSHAQPSPRQIGIQKSYDEAFCRPATGGELKHWEGREVTNVNVHEHRPYLDLHRAYIKQDATARREAVVKSYYVGTQGRHTPSEAEIKHWTDRIQKSGETCREMAALHSAHFNLPARASGGQGYVPPSQQPGIGIISCDPAGDPRCRTSGSTVPVPKR